MKKLHRLSVLGLICMAVSAQGMDEQSANQAAAQFLQAVDRHTSMEGIPRVHVRRERMASRLDIPVYWWSTDTGVHDVSLADEDGVVNWYTNDRLYSRANGPESIRRPTSGPPFYSSEQNLIAIAASRLDAIGWAHGPDTDHRPLPRPDGNGNIPRSIIYVSFNERPNGYPCIGGNTVQIGLDSLTGEVVELQRDVGYHGGPPVVHITPQQALDIARQATAVAEDSRAQGPVYGDILFNAGTISQRGQGLIRSRILPLIYGVHGLTEDLLIAADTGEILCRYNNAVASAPVPGQPIPPKGKVPRSSENWATNSRRVMLARQTKRQDPSRTTLLVGSGIAILALAGLAVLMLRKA